MVAPNPCAVMSARSAPSALSTSNSAAERREVDAHAPLELADVRLGHLRLDGQGRQGGEVQDDRRHVGRRQRLPIGSQYLKDRAVGRRVDAAVAVRGLVAGQRALCEAICDSSCTMAPWARARSYSTWVVASSAFRRVWRAASASARPSAERCTASCASVARSPARLASTRLRWIVVSISAIRSPLANVSPTLTCSFCNCPETWAPTSTSRLGFSVPDAVTTSPSARWPMVAERRGRLVFPAAATGSEQEVPAADGRNRSGEDPHPGPLQSRPRCRRGFVEAVKA